MAIKPVDLQIMIPRTMEAAKASNDVNHRNLTAQQQQAAATQHRAEDSLKQVYSRSQPHNAQISEKQKDNSSKDGKGKKSGGKSAGDEGNEHNRPNDEITTSIIDIKI